MPVLMAAVPPRERPRERLLAVGAEGLADRELLALILGYGTRGTSALDLASELLAEYGGLGQLAKARAQRSSPSGPAWGQRSRQPLPRRFSSARGQAGMTARQQCCAAPMM